MEQLLIAALVCASVSFTVSMTGIFKRVRESKIFRIPFLDGLIHCPYCLGHWVALVYMLLTGYYIEMGSAAVSLVVTWFAIVGLMGVIHYVLLRAYAPVAKANAKRELERLNKT